MPIPPVLKRKKRRKERREERLERKNLFGAADETPYLAVENLRKATK
jgi:hypothetical protein